MRFLRRTGTARYFANMTLLMHDTIAALASAPGAGGRGIVRISGDEAKNVIGQHFTPDDAARWGTARRAERHPGVWHLSVESPWQDVSFRAGVRLAVDVYLWPKRRSYTGRPLAELHLVSSPPLLEAVLTQLIRSGCRTARPGEFTLRAFLAGKLDLLQAEAVLGVIDAADHEELNLALRQLAGGISHRMATLRGELLDLLADLEAGLDFADDDIEFVSREQLVSRATAAQQKLIELCDQAGRRLHSSARSRVVLAGLPNAGKSTLLNALCGQSAALVSESRGTTRDYICVPLDRGPLHIDLIDTAGWDHSVDGIDAVAQQLRHEQWQQADLIVWCSDSSADEASKRADNCLFGELSSERRLVLRVATKVDLARGQTSEVFKTSKVSTVSAHDGSGLEELCERMADGLAAESRCRRQWLGMTAARCHDSLQAACDSVNRLVDSAKVGLGEDLIVIELRDALEHLGQIVGAVYTDDVLDRVFSRFCIGK